MEAMRSSGKSALAKWAWKAKQYVVQVRPTEEGLVLQQLLYAEEVRSFKELNIEPVPVSAPELRLALQLIDQISEPAYDPTQFKDEEKLRVLDAIDRKIAGQEVVASVHSEDEPVSGQVIDLMAALQASLGKKQAPVVAVTSKGSAAKQVSNVATMPEAKVRKGAKRATALEAEVVSPPARARSKK
jgi:DNA end-binding protein Ku